jgi:hypothetical protein
MKKVLLGIVALVVLVAATIAYLNNRNRTLSPPGEAKLSNSGISVSVKYSRPSVRGRVIFGTKEQSALQPYGEYWRLGANEATEVTFDKNVTFNGSPLKAGTYRLYAIPGATEFEVIVNSELGVWGVFEPDPAQDVLRTKVSVQSAAVTEQFTINLLPAEGGIDISFEWANVKFVVPVKGQQ